MTNAVLEMLRQRAPGFVPRIAVILGSGWGGFANHLHPIARFAYADLPGFPLLGVTGHGGELLLGTLGEQTVAVLNGRKHGYETGAVDAMRVPLEALHAMGCRVLVQTNAAGSLRVDLPPLSLLAISDHLNLPQRSPLVGMGGVQRFVDMVGAYDAALRAQAMQRAALQGVAMQEGVYAWALGPQFETPAEIRMLGKMGADVVGMSTVPETILARYLGMQVLALSLVTNMGAGLSQEQLSHAHTLQQAAVASDAASAFLAHLIGNLQLNE